MPESSSRWKSAAFLLVAVETAALFWAYYAFNLGGWLRTFASDGTILRIPGQIRAAGEALLPRGIMETISGVVTVSGISGPLQTFVSRASVLGSGVTTSSLGSAVVAPAYFAARRFLRHRSLPGRAGQRRLGTRRKAPATRKPFERVDPASTVVQEAL